MIITIEDSYFKKNVQYLRRKHKIPLQKMVDMMEMEKEEYKERIEDWYDQNRVILKEDELDKLCEILCESPSYLARIDLEELEANKNPAL